LRVHPVPLVTALTLMAGKRSPISRAQRRIPEPGTTTPSAPLGAEHTITIDLGGDDTRTVRRTTTQAVRSIKAHRPREVRAAHVS
jgi:hypothetical protein